MAIINPIPGGLKIKDTYDIIYSNDDAINQQLQNHIDGLADKHNSSEIINDSGVSGALQADANNTLKSLIDALVLGPSNATIGAYPISVTGTNTYVGTFTDLTYFTGLMINLTDITENTAASTININGLGAKSIKIRLQDGSLRDVESGELHDEIQVIYDGTQFVVLDNGAKGSEKSIRDSFHADADRYVGNTKIADDGQDLTGVTGGGNITFSEDTTQNLIGKKGIRLTSNSALDSNGSITIPVSLDFSKHIDGTNIEGEDYISLGVNIEDFNKLQDINVFFVTSSGNYYTVAYTTNKNGKQILNKRKNEFSTVGSPDWANITQIIVEYNYPINSNGNWIVYQFVQSVKKSPDGAFPSPFQYNGVTEFTINSSEWYVGQEYGKNGIIPLSTSTTYFGLIGSKKYKDFERMSHICEVKTTSSKPFTWYVDNDNYISVFANSGNILLWKVQNGISSSKNLLSNVSNGDIVTLEITKKGNEIEVFYIEDKTSLKDTITIGDNFGYLALGINGANSDKTLSISITEIAHAHHADIAEVAKRLEKSLTIEVSDSDMLNSWVNNTASGTYNTVGYYRADDTVYLKGRISSGVLAANAFILESGFIPRKNVILNGIGWNGSNTVPCRVVINTDGEVTISDANTWVSLESLSFSLS